MMAAGSISTAPLQRFLATSFRTTRRATRAEESPQNSVLPAFRATRSRTILRLAAAEALAEGALTLAGRARLFLSEITLRTIHGAAAGEESVSLPRGLQPSRTTSLAGIPRAEAKAAGCG